MKKILLLLLFIASYGTAIKAQETVEFILRLDSIKENYLVPKYSSETDTYSIPEDAIDSYIQQFDKVRINKKVKCYYSRDNLGGRPYLYIHRWFKKHAAANFAEPIDDSPMAYFQYLIFREYGEQFALFWYALYDMKKIWTTHPFAYHAKAREKALKKIGRDWGIPSDVLTNKELTREVERKLGEELQLNEKESQDMLEWLLQDEMPNICSGEIIDVELNREFTEKGMAPKITMDVDECIITLFEENHSYLTQKTYKVQRKKPWKIELDKELLIVEKFEIIY